MPCVNDLIQCLDEAVAADCGNACCLKVKDVLEEVIASGQDFIAPEFLKPVPESYARRLLHRDPEGRYSVLVMVWDKGQGTPIHDHAGMWCCECVYRGRIEVVSYDRADAGSGDTAEFTEEQRIMAGVGEAGALIPPFDYHTIENVDETPAVTIHVYGGDMTWCHAFVPEGGRYRRVRKELGFSA